MMSWSGCELSLFLLLMRFGWEVGEEDDAIPKEGSRGRRE